ncbi:MAG: glycosyltransferase, partial [Sphingomonas bacterium]
YSFTVHGPDEFDDPRGLDLAGKVAESVACVAISSYGRSQLMRWSAFEDWGKIIVARCGIDESFAEPALARPAPAAPRLVCVARLSAQKGLPLLVEAAGRLKARGVDFHLTLVGDGEMRAGIETQIGAEGLGETIAITGWTAGDRVREELLAARAMILPSFAEGLPVVIMEALALGRPVIASRIAGTPELVDEGCGWLVPAGDVDALVTAMEAALAATPETLDAMGAEGRRRVLAMHDAGRNGAGLLADLARLGARA